MAGAQFSKGEEVEVTIPEEGFRGSWFSATVIRPVAKTNKIYVQYHSLLKERGKATKLKEYVNPFFVRPLPPRETDRIFKLHDEVDAYHDDGWWKGDITRVVEEEEGIEKFVVYFRASKEERTFGPSELRIHREWIKGSWDPPMALADEQQGTLSNLGADQNKESSKLVISKGKRSISKAYQTNESSKLMMNLRSSTLSKSRADQTNEPSKSGADKTKESPKPTVKPRKEMSSKSGTDVQNIIAPSKETPSTSEGDAGGRPSLEFGETHFENEKSFGGDALQSHSDHVGAEFPDDISATDLWGFQERRRFDLQEYLKNDSLPCSKTMESHTMNVVFDSRFKTLHKIKKDRREMMVAAGPSSAGPSSAGPITVTEKKRKSKGDKEEGCCSHSSFCVTRRCVCYFADKKCKNSCKCRKKICRNR